MGCNAEHNDWLSSRKPVERKWLWPEHRAIWRLLLWDCRSCLWAFECFLLHIQCLEVLAVNPCLGLWAFQKWVGGFYNSRVLFCLFFFPSLSFLKQTNQFHFLFTNISLSRFPPAPACPHHPKFLCSLYASQVVWGQKLHCTVGYIVTSLSSFFNY